jgi:hypothetical protein
MSGLASFFRHHLQHKTTDERGEDYHAESVGNLGGGGSAEVDRARRMSLRLGYGASLEETEPLEDDDLGLSPRNRRRNTPKPPFTDHGRHDDEPSEGLVDPNSRAARGDPWKEWRRACRRQLTTYMEKRIINSHSSRWSGGNREGGGAAAGIATTASLVSWESGNGDDADASSVVNVHDTRHDVSYLSDLTLSTRRLVRCSGVVSRVVDGRSAKRHSLRMTTRRRWSVDGPLIFGYSRVVSFEVTQWLLGEENELRQRAQHCMNEKPKTRMMVFLYDGWAQAFEAVLKRKPASSSSSSSDPPPALLLRMENIPAACVFPYDEADWADSDMVPYCVCIGDKSPTIKNETSSLRFDDGVRLHFQHCSGWSQYPRSASDEAEPAGAGVLSVWSIAPTDAGVETNEGETSTTPLFGSVVRRIVGTADAACRVSLSANATGAAALPAAGPSVPGREATEASSSAAPSAATRLYGGSLMPNLTVPREPVVGSPTRQGNTYYTLVG